MGEVIACDVPVLPIFVPLKLRQLPLKVRRKGRYLLGAAVNFQLGEVVQVSRSFRGFDANIAIAVGA